MKLKRSKKDYGSGGGSEIFESDLFRVTLWNSEGGKNTRICYQPTHYEIKFEGYHKFKTDKACMEQLNFSEIMKIIKTEKKEGFELGKIAKANEIMSCLRV